MASDIDRVIQRTFRSWYEDGLTEIAAGAIFIAVALVFLAEALSPPGLLAGLSAILLPLVVLGGALLARRGVLAVKKRLIYPRTGYVAYRHRAGRRVLPTVIVAAGMGALVSFLLLAAPASQAWIPAVQGFLVGAFWLWLAYRMGLVRFYVYGASSALAGTASSLAGLGDILGSGAYFAAQGTVMVVAGALALMLYLRSEPVEG